MFDAAQCRMRRPMRLPECRSVSAFFFFFSWIRVNSAQFAPTRLNLCRIGFDLRRTGLIRPKSGRIGHIGADTIETGRKWLKHAENGRNLL